MAKKEHQILGVDLGIINQAGKGAGISLQPENLDSQPGFSEDTEESFDAFSELMKAVEKANTSLEDLSPDELFLLSVSGYRIR
jgi:hypothetical protein